MKTLDIEFKRHDRYFDYPMTSICKKDGRSARELRSRALEGDRAFLQCWSRDLGNKGAKEFYVAGLDEFTDYYLGLTPSERCYYELIHSEFPLKLYFDVDISATKNPVMFAQYSSAESVVDMLVTSLTQHFSATELEDCIVLQSSAESKRSYHVIFPRIVFVNMASLATWIKAHHASFVEPDIVDKAPYNSFQSFRLHLSSKKDKKRWFQLCGHEELSEKEKLKVSLVQYFDAEGKMPLTAYVFVPESPRSSMSIASRETHRNKKRRVYGPDCTRTSPELDAALKKLAKHKVIPADATIYSHEKFNNVVVFNFKGTCQIVGREHASNHIKFVLYLDSKHGRYYCYDPECCATEKGRQGWGAACYSHCFPDWYAQPIIDKYGLTLLVEQLTTSWYTVPEGVRLRPVCTCEHERAIMFHRNLERMQCKGCMTCRKVTPTFMKRVEKQVNVWRSK